ncbi:ATP-binding protein [Ruminococcus sp. AF25-13]|nr:ATP-binding protein [Mediterraneibacter faecis]MCB5890064.1 ATP-binding protein [Lachnospiraceae bacterium 210521-DFI.4.71]RGG20906.1 ATP-binding protein [Ruminococcus sp. AF25-3LB]RGG27551.1 ATP-binding protein [Ruminococcus sp. AF25-17]RGG30345.1 ATP-binding protein [Ruminococcus sp. AF25-13]RGI33714.1 ATP-binding protein [Ruminococcus sp. OM07-7]
MSVTLRKKKNRINLSVINTTESISKEQISHLFDRFYRTDASRNSQTGGYGLGLSIAAATVESHRGKISAGRNAWQWWRKRRHERRQYARRTRERAA